MKPQQRPGWTLRLAIGWTLFACRAWGLPEGEEPSAVPPLSTASPDSDSPEQLYAAALKSYEEGELEAALGFMQACHDATKSPNLLFNLGQLHAELKHCALARDSYQDYLKAVPNGEMRQEAEQQIASLESQCPRRPTTPEAGRPVEDDKLLVSPVSGLSKSSPSALEPVPVAQSPNPDRAWVALGWIAAGAGAVSAVASVHFALETRSAKQDVESTHEQLRAGTLMYEDAAIEQRADDFYRNRTLTYVSGAGAIALIVGSVCAFVAARPLERDSIAISATSRMMAADWQFRF